MTRIGVRPGVTTMLPVLDNDNDPDGDVLVAALAEAQPAVGTIQQVQNGGSLQIAVEEGASGSTTSRTRPTTAAAARTRRPSH